MYTVVEKSRDQLPDRSNQRSSCPTTALHKGIDIGDLAGAKIISSEAASRVFGGDRTSAHSPESPDLRLSSPAGWSESIQTVLAQPPATLSRQLVFMGLLFVSLLGTWACLGKMQEVSSATGELIPQGETFKIQPVAAGEINRILVGEGDVVSKGDLLFTIDSTLLDNEILRLEKTLSATQLELSQVRSLIEQTRRENMAQEQSAQSDIQAKQATKTASKANTQTSELLLASLAKESAAYEERLARLSSLEAKGAISREYLFEVEQGVFDRQKSVGQTQGELDQSLAYIQQIEAELDQKRAIAQQIAVAGEQALQKLQVEAGQLEATLANTQSLIEEAQAQLAQTQVRSPVSGIISALDIDNVGEFAQPGVTLAEVVPESTPLVLSVLMPPAKAGLIKPNMPVNIKLDAFPYQNYGLLSGTVLSISPDAKKDPETGSGYKIEIALDTDQVMHEGHLVSLQVGQTASADIVIRQRRIIDLVLDPIRRIQSDDLNL